MPNYDTGAIRNLLTEVFPDVDEIEFFADDYFKEVKFEPDMPLKKRAHVLTQYCAQNNQLDKLLAFLQKNHPAKYAEHSVLLTLDAPSIAPATSATSEPAVSQPPTRTPEPSPAAEPAATPQGQDVFISYSTKNLDFVQQLYQKLTSRGLSVWFDKQSIEGATQWRESIVTGIMNCKVFLLVLSPESAASDNVRKEIDLAEHHKKKIFPLMWREVRPLPPSIQYQLAGTQYISFDGTPSEENFNKVYHVVDKLLGGSGVAEAAAGEKAIQAPGVTDQPAASTAPTASSGRPRRGTAPEVGVIAAGIGVMSKVVDQIGGFTPAEKDANNEELKWLFVAADHFLKIRRGEVQRTVGVPVETPAEATTTQTTKNAVLLPSVDDFSMQMIDSQIQSIIKQINIYMKNLAFELDKQAQLGGQAGSNIALKNSIDAQQKAIIERTQELANLMQQIYGVKVYAPEIVAEKLT
ncbi:MAG: toll/interleukin-1 receptor domain-containing protein [Anaerolineae bacterium]|nr:toll/interleukin-1 receptor domain-containing protein [Anaerolineae bacterium]